MKRKVGILDLEKLLSAKSSKPGDEFLTSHEMARYLGVCVNKALGIIRLLDEQGMIEVEIRRVKNLVGTVSVKPFYRINLEPQAKPKSRRRAKAKS